MTPQAIQPYLTVTPADEAIAFYQAAFGAEIDEKMMAEDGKRIMHCTLMMMGAQVMLADAFPEFMPEGAAVLGPKELGGSTVTLHFHLDAPEAVDAAMDRAAQAGATITMAAHDAFWGCRYGRIIDPFGHHWAFMGPLNETN